ncbi:hypothetical protein IAT40_007242 [Kwoniella sp. CBS 6097]
MTSYLSAPSTHHRTPRVISNKENSPSPSVFEFTDIDAISTSLRTSLSGVNPSSTAKKPTLGGLSIGRAPKFTYRKHSSKPYGRVTSVQRAKKAANANANANANAGGKARPTGTTVSQEVRRSKRGLKNRPNPIKFVDRDVESLSAGAAAGVGAGSKGLRGNMGVMDRVRLDRWRRSIWRPSMSVLGSNTNISLNAAESSGSGSGCGNFGASLGQIRVPLMLPYPKFPPVSPIRSKEFKDVPVQYISDRLAPLLPSISTITLAHRPYSTVPHPSSSSSSSTAQQTLALAIPEVLDGSKPHWADKAQGREPDMCLGIVKKGKEVEGAKMIVPVLSLVFATRCAYWPKLTTPPANQAPSTSRNVPQIQPLPQSQSQRHQPTPSEKAVSTLLPCIEEEREEAASTSTSASASDTEVDTNPDADADTSFSSDSSWASEPDSDFESDGSASALPRPIRDSRGFLHLPIVTLPLPSPETFGLIHRHLHHPQRAFIPDLLSIPDHCISRSSIIDALSDQSVQDLMGKLEVLQGVWQNLCTLGIGRLSTWRQLGEAWACVVGIIAGNGILLKGIEEGLGSAMEVDGVERGDREVTRKKARTAAEDVAWEWVRREKKRIAKEHEGL